MVKRYKGKDDYINLVIDNDGARILNVGGIFSPKNTINIPQLSNIDHPIGIRNDRQFFSPETRSYIKEALNLE